MIPEQLFTKEDSDDDRIFYASPRLAKHIDENACQTTIFWLGMNNNRLTEYRR